MPLREGITLTTPLIETGVVAARQAEMLATMGLTNVGRLIAHLPTRHETLEAEGTIAALTPGSIGATRGEIVSVRPARFARPPRIEAVLMDHTARLDVVWFNQMYLHEKMQPGLRVRVQGKVQRKGNLTQMVNPLLEVLDPRNEEPAVAEARLRPVYPATEAISSGAIGRVIAKILPAALPLLEDHLPEDYRRERDLPSLAEAYRMQHAPRDEEEVLQSRRRLAYDELLMLQLGVAMKRVQLRSLHSAPALRITEDILARIRARIPFPLTKGQESVLQDLIRDLSGATPTNRLIQGDVGSGKTIIALAALLLAVASGHQGSLMAPTEILAEQHYATISRLLDGSRVRIALLTGSLTPREREAIHHDTREGAVDILIGTHALLSESVEFKSLAVAIIDEQHRFGVSQRATLRARATDDAITPHVIVMTATPIPRSLALTLFGDLDISTIDGLPPGRTPVATTLISSHDRKRAYDDLARRIRMGQQGYVVVPAVDPSAPCDPRSPTSTPLVDVHTARNAIEKNYIPGARVAILHGQLTHAEREHVLHRFRAREVDLLVATTVIEVGIDVPNATIMIVEQAERFGLAQLHQLRGRVGRGHVDSACYLIADPVTSDAHARLSVMTSTHDGFVLAEKDMEIRGMGEVFGTRQAGMAPFLVADPIRDRELLNLARRDARNWIAHSTRLDRPQELLIKKRMLKLHGKFLGLADVG